MGVLVNKRVGNWGTWGGKMQEKKGKQSRNIKEDAKTHWHQREGGGLHVPWGEGKL